MLTSTIRMEKECDLSDFDRGMIVGAREGGLSISETADLLAFSSATSLGFAENGAKNQKRPVSSSSLGRNALLMKEVRGEGPDWSKLIERCISEQTTHQTSKWMGYSSRRLNMSKK